MNVYTFSLSQFLLTHRQYPLGHRGIALPGEDLWLIETPGVRTSIDKLAHVGEDIPPRPPVARIVGVVRFDDCFEYEDQASFLLDDRHRIVTDGPYEWVGGRRFGWKIERLLTYEFNKNNHKNHNRWRRQA